MTDSPDVYLITCPACKAVNRVPSGKKGEPGKCGNCHGQLPPLYLHPVPLTDTTFDSFVAGYPGPILAEFWAPW